MNLDRLKKTLQKHEGLRMRPYKDTVGKLTIGIGRNLDDIGISEQEAFFLLDNDIQRAVDLTKRILPEFQELDDLRQEVLVNMAFNMGNGLQEFKKMLAATIKGEYDVAANEMLSSRWAKQVGQRAIDLAKWMKEGEPKVSRKIIQPK